MTEKIVKDRISRVIHRRDSKAVAFLFGSRARGDHRKDSDWDILILVDKKEITNEIENEFRNDLYTIELETGQIISTFIYPKEYWESTLIYSPLYKNVMKEGIKL
jgi:predicted nucleotidyltransferase